MPQYMTGAATCMFAVPHNVYTVNQYPQDSSRIAVRIYVSCLVCHFFGVEQHKIGPHPFSNKPPVLKAETHRRQRSHFSDGLFETQSFFFPHILADYPGESSI